MSKALVRLLALILALLCCTAAKQNIAVRVIFVDLGIVSETKIEKPAGQNVQRQGNVFVFE
jgi:uncharacterized lipoprotein NlpE involved in copper resistance